MMENHIAYKIMHGTTGLVCTHAAFHEDKMLDLLKDIQKKDSKEIYWIFKQLEGKPQAALCVIDCGHNRVYFHHSGEVVKIAALIKKLNKA